MLTNKTAFLKNYRYLANFYCVMELQWVIVFDVIIGTIILSEIVFLKVMIKKLKQKRKLMLEYNEYSNSNVET